MKILLATPIASLDELWGQYAKGTGTYLPLGLLSIAGVVRETGYEVLLHDSSTPGTTVDSFQDYLEKEQFDVIGLDGCYTALAHLVFRTVNISCQTLLNVTIVIGGVHHTLFPVKTL